MEDNGDLGRARTPDFPTRYLPMVQGRAGCSQLAEAEAKAAIDPRQCWRRLPQYGGMCCAREARISQSSW